MLIKKEVDPFTNKITYDYTNVKYIDAKYLHDSPFSSNQLEIVNGVKNNGVANCTPFNKAILDVNGNPIIPVNQTIQIKSVEKLTIDDLMNLVIQ